VGSGAPIDRAPTEAAAPGGPSPSGDALAGRWSSALEQLVARAAHEINNALNGAVMNVEVVRLRARPGVDGATSATFAESAAGELERAAALVGALVALGRGTRQAVTADSVDVGEVLRQVVVLLAPALAHRHVTLVAEAGRGQVATVAPLAGVRLAVAGALLAAADTLAERAGGTRSTGGPAHVVVESAGSHPADEPVRLLRCTLRLDLQPELRLTGETVGGAESSILPLALPDAGDVAALEAVGIRFHVDGHAVVVRFPLHPGAA
jgi:hypothetical protein